MCLIFYPSPVVEDPRGCDAVAGVGAGGHRGADQVGQRQVRPGRIPAERRHGRHTQSR